MIRHGLLATVTALVLAACATQTPKPNLASSAPITLGTQQAEIVGTNAVIEKNPSDEHIGYWDDKATYIQWKIKDLRMGHYQVNAEYAADSTAAGTIIHFQGLGQMLEQTLTPTASWHDYRPLPLGTLDVKSTGDATLMLKAERKPGRYIMNLKRITLTPM